MAVLGIVAVLASKLPAEESIDPRFGRLSAIETDLQLQAGVISLELVRVLAEGPGETGLLGKRWRLNWETRLFVPQSEALLDESGIARSFAREANGGYVAANGERLLRTGTNRYTLARLDGTSDLFDNNGRLLERDMRNNNRVFLRYAPGGRLIRVEGPAGAFFTFSYDGTGRLTRVDTSARTFARYAYSGDRLDSVETSGSPQPTRYRYDTSDRLSRIENAGAGMTELSYDRRGRVTTRRLSSGQQETWQYDDGARRVRYTDPTGAVTLRQRSADGRTEEIVDPLGTRTVLQYDDHGQITQVTGPTGQTARFSYDSLGRLTRTEDANSRATVFEYLERSSLAKSITGPDGVRQAFEYDAQRNLAAIKTGTVPLVTFTYSREGLVESIKDADGALRRFTYTPQGYVTSDTDSLGNRIQFDYDQRGNLVRETGAAGSVTLRAYDRYDRLIAKTNPAGALTRMQYDDGGRLTQVTDPTGGVFRLEYDPNSQLTKLTDPTGKVARYQYDPAGRPTKITSSDRTLSHRYDRAGRVAESTDGSSRNMYTRDPLGRVLAETDAIGRTTRYDYYPDDRIKTVTDPAGQKWQLDYGPAGNLRQVISPLGGVSKREFDGQGRLKSLSSPSGYTIRFESSAAGLVTGITDPLGKLRYEYDGNGRLVKLTDGTNYATKLQYTADGYLAKIIPTSAPAISYEYDKVGNRISVSEGNTWVARYRHDKLGRVIHEQHATGLEISYIYDAMGNMLGWKDNLGAAGTMQYDGAGRLTAFKDAFGAATQYSYDGNGNLRNVTDALGRSQQLVYSPAGEITQVTEPTGDTAKYEYNLAGLLAKIRQPGGGEIRLGYDAIGNPVKVSDPLGKEQSTSYDAAGRLLSTTDAKGQTTKFQYDAAGRLSERRLSDGKVVTYRYDAVGNLTQVDDGVFPVRRGYDANGRLSRIEYPKIKRTLSYEYDSTGMLTKFIDSEGQIIRYEYDNAKRLRSINAGGNQSIVLTYDAKNRLTSMTYPNGVRGGWEYDPADRPIRITYTDAAGKTLMGWKYSYDAVGNRVETTDAQNRTIRYQYDKADQLIEEKNGSGKSVRYAYLAGGNRGKREDGAKSVQYRYDAADRLLAAGEESFSHDANGNLTERRGAGGVTRYSYDSEDRLLKVTQPDASEVTFGYAPTGERVWRKDKTGTTYFVTDGTNLLTELSGDLKPKASYLHGPGIDLPLIMSRDERHHFYHADLLGNVSALTDERGQLAATYEYDAFGTVTNRQGTLTNPFTYTAREYDAAIGLYFYRARYYDPALGRFLSRDPLPSNPSMPLSFNPYIYVRNNPINFTDPLGLAQVPAPLNPTGVHINSVLTKAGYSGVNYYQGGWLNWIRSYGGAAAVMEPGAGVGQPARVWFGPLIPWRWVSNNFIIQVAKHEFQHWLQDQRPAASVPAARVQRQGGMVTDTTPGNPLRALHEGPGLLSTRGEGSPQRQGWVRGILNRFGAEAESAIMEAEAYTAGDPFPFNASTVRSYIAAAQKFGGAAAHALAEALVDRLRNATSGGPVEQYTRNMFPNLLGKGNNASPSASSPLSGSGKGGAENLLPQGSDRPGPKALSLGNLGKASLLGGAFGTYFGAGDAYVKCMESGGNQSACLAAAGWGGLWGAGTGSVIGAAFAAAEAAGGRIAMAATGLGGGLAFWGAVKGAINIKRFIGEAGRLNQSTDDMKKGRWINEHNPALNNDNINRMLAKLRADLSRLQQLHASLGSSSGRGADSLAHATAKVAQLEALANLDPGEIQRSCTSLDALVKKLKSSTTIVATHVRASMRILADPDPRVNKQPLSASSLNVALDQMKLGAQAASAARAERESAANALKTLEQTSPQAGDSKYQEIMTLLGPAQGDSASESDKPAGAGDKVAAFQGAKNDLLISSRRMMDAIAENLTLGTRWVDFNQIYLQAYNLNLPGSRDHSAGQSGSAADLQARANAAIKTIRSRPANPCTGTSLAEGQAQWEAIKQLAQSMVATYDARVAKMRDFAQRAEQLIRGEGARKIEEARARRDANMQREAERIVRETRELKAAAERENARLKEVENVAASLRTIN